MSEKVVLEVRNPRSHINIDEPHAIAPRLDTLNGKRIAMLQIKPDARIYLEYLTKLLQERYPTAVFVSMEAKNGPFTTLRTLPGFDAYIYGVKNTAGFNDELATGWEKDGTPGVTLVTEPCIGQTYRHAMTYGVPMRSLVLPCEKWFAEEEVDEFRRLAENSVEDIIHALTDPLTEEEQHPKKFEYDISDLRFEGADYAEAYGKFQEYFMEHKFTDGMSVAPPTQAAVDQMLTGTTRRPDEVIAGEMTPSRGIVTVEKIAINAVMAGAKPEYLPVIITTMEMLCDPDFYAFHPLATITSPQLMIAVGGPIGKEIGMNCKTGYLGPGNRANSTIGRAVSLCAINLGWLDFDIDGGMSGQPSRYCNLTFCENEEESPWEPFHVTMGFEPEDSTVTIEEVLHVDGYWWKDITNMPSGSVWTYGLQNDLDRIADRAVGPNPVLEDIINGAHNVNNLTFFDGPKQWTGARKYALVIYPGQARQLAAAGYSKADVAKYIGNYRRVPWEKIPAEIQKGLLEFAQSEDCSPNLSVEDCRPGGTIPVCNPDNLAIFVSGPLGGQTLGFYCMGSYRSFTDNPPKVPYFTKKITGAALTKAGR